MVRKRQQKSTRNPITRTWKEIRQSGAEKAITAAAQRRKVTTLLKAGGSLLIFIILIGGGTWALLQWYQTPESTLGREHAEPLGQIHFDTDGVLTRKWVGRTLSIRPGTTLLDLSIFELKERLEMSGQVESAVVERHFPDTLKIVLKERIPVARLAVEDGFGGIETLMVAADGTVYRGRDYDPVFEKMLPYLDGVVPVKDALGNFKPIRGMGLASEFLSISRYRFPEFYHDLRVVDLGDMQAGSELPGAGFEARCRNYPAIRFAPEGLDRQLDRLEVVLRDLNDRIEEARPRDAVERVDLSMDGPVVVSFHER
jgi:hypothetical protein